MNKSTHANFDQIQYDDWRKLLGNGDDFIDDFLIKYNNREEPTNFEYRKKITYVPTVGLQSVEDLINAVTARLPDIRRSGDAIYEEVMAGGRYGVDRGGIDMNTFLMDFVLPELLFMGKVGVLVDNANEVQLNDVHPYLVFYKADEIQNWQYINNKLVSVLLKTSSFEIKDGLPTSKQIVTYTQLTLANGRVLMETQTGSEEIQVQEIEMDTLPFTIVSIPRPLMEVIFKPTIALMNLSSSEKSIILKAGPPIYTEQSGAGTSQLAVEIGAGDGRRYPINTERPGWITADPQMVDASLRLRESIINEIKAGIGHSVSTMNKVRVSAESKEVDEQSLYKGLSALGVRLEIFEQWVNKIFHIFLGKNHGYVIYPEDYTFDTDESLLSNASKLLESVPKLQSLTAQKALLKKIVRNFLDRKFDFTLIDAEIDELDMYLTDTKEAMQLLESGGISIEFYHKLKKLPKEVTLQAKAELAERMNHIVSAQGGPGAALGGNPRKEVTDVRNNE